MASIKVKYRPSTTNGKEGSIYYQVIHGRTVRQIGTDFRVLDTEWDKEASSVRIMPETDENRKRYLHSVAEHIGWDIRRLQAIIAQCDRLGGSYSAYNIVEKFNSHANGQSLFGFMQDIIRQLKQLGKVRTSETYTAALASFMKFREGQDILLDEIDSDTMMLYEAWLKSNGNCPNTTSFYMRILRAVYNRAVEKELTEQKYPFKHVYTGIGKTVKRALPLKSIKRIKELDLTLKPHLDYARDMFLFSFYTGTRPDLETASGLCTGYVPLFVLHPWYVVHRHGLFKEIGLEEQRHHIPQEKDGAATEYQMGEVHGGNHRQIRRLFHRPVPTADNHQPMR